MTAEIAMAAPEVTTGPKWLRRVDSLTIRVGDWFNPILIKEARQALKSKQFVLTFSLLLVAAWGWTAVAILMLMPGIYYKPSGTTLLWGYYLVLAVPMLLVVPLAAHRSLASEVDDGTLDLLSVTNLSPMQIITGKLASAALQIMLYFVALFPCVAFSYLLRGVDLLTIVGVLGLAIGAAAILTIAGLFFASLATGRSGQLGMMVMMLIIVGVSQFAIAGTAFSMINYGFSEDWKDFAIAAFFFAMYVVTFCYLLLRAAAAQLSPPSENRSTSIRIALIIHQCAVFAMVAYLLMAYGVDDDPVYFAICYMAGFWMLCGTLMVGETDVLTPRIRRDLPSSFLARSLLTWLTPGSGTGLIFAVSSFLGFCCALYFAILFAETGGAGARMVAVDPRPLIVTLAGYMMMLLALTRWFMKLLRRRANPSASVALAVLAIVAGFIALIPYGIELHLNDYNRINWSPLQITNWAWTLGLALDNRLDPGAPYLIFSIGGILWIASLVTLGAVVLPLRVETPQRVLEQQRLDKSADTSDTAPIDPLAI
jgi:ABC-type transport system involved in cytochrome c biogenesis permease component